MEKVKYYKLFDEQFITDIVKSSIKSAVVRNSNIEPKEIEVTDWGFIQGFGHLSVRMSKGYALPSKEEATRAALNFITATNKDWANKAYEVLPQKTPTPYLFPTGLQHDYTRFVTENNKPKYWEVNFRLHLNAGVKQTDCVAYGGGVAIYVGATGRIIGLNHTARTYTSSSESDLFKVIDDTPTNTASDLSIVYLFDFRKNIIAPYFLKIGLNSDIKEAQQLDNFTIDKNYNWIEKQENWKIDKTNLVPACKESSILEYGKYQCIANRTLIEGDLRYIIKPLMDTQNIRFEMLWSDKRCDLSNDEQNLTSFTEALNETFAYFGIKTAYQRIHFIAQIALETALFTTTNEFADGTAYNPSRRKDAIENENTEEGDGPRYKGRGFMQITWRKNYLKYFAYISNHFNRYRTWITHNGKSLENDLLGILQQTQKEAKRDSLTPQLILDILGQRDHKFFLMLSHSIAFASDSAGWYWSEYRTVRRIDFSNSKIPINEDIIGLPINIAPDYKDLYLILICYMVNGGSNGRAERKEYYKILKNLLNNDFLCDM